MSLLLSLILYILYIRYYDIQSADDLRVTSYCDNSSLLETQEEYHTRDVDSSSWYLKPDHDVIMTFSDVKKKLPFELVSLHVRSHQDEKHDYADLTTSEQLNVPAGHRATAALNELRADG
jgi:hypothetical protein